MLLIMVYHILAAIRYGILTFWNRIIAGLDDNGIEKKSNKRWLHLLRFQLARRSSTVPIAACRDVILVR